MNPFVVIRYGNQECRSSVVRGQPTWSFILCMYLHAFFFFFFCVWDIYIYLFDYKRGLELQGKERNQYGMRNLLSTLSTRVVKITNISLLFISWTSTSSLTRFLLVKPRKTLFLSPNKIYWDCGEINLFLEKAEKINRSL